MTLPDTIQGEIKQEWVEFTLKGTVDIVPWQLGMGRQSYQNYQKKKGPEQ